MRRSHRGALRIRSRREPGDAEPRDAWPGRRGGPALSSGSGPALLAVVGATGTGKSALSIALAEQLADRGTPAEVVNADAMQLYRGMDVGTAKLSPSERRGIPHHLLDVLDPRDEASVSAYQEQARRVIVGILDRGAVPVLVGGSGLYVSSVLYDYRFPGTDPEIRRRLEAEAEREGTGALHRRLARLDAEAARAISAHNARRIVRALEVIEITGEPFGAGLPSEQRRWMPSRIIGLRLDRPRLVERLDTRVEAMWRHGLLAEAQRLREHGLGTTAARAIGYAQALDQLDGRVSEAEAIAAASALTRRYARRQVSWFGRYGDIAWFDAEAPALLDDALTVATQPASPAG